MSKSRPLQPPALDPTSMDAISGSGYPEPFGSRMGARYKRRLGAACGLTQFGVNLVTLGPGGQSALRHWHTLEDEFVYVIAGEVTLVTNDDRRVLSAGMCAGYPAGERNAHQFVNESSEQASYLEIGSQVKGDNAFYPDDDLMWIETEDGVIAAHKDGRAYE